MCGVEWPGNEEDRTRRKCGLFLSDVKRKVSDVEKIGFECSPGLYNVALN